MLTENPNILPLAFLHAATENSQVGAAFLEPWNMMGI